MRLIKLYRAYRSATRHAEAIVTFDEFVNLYSIDPEALMPEEVSVTFAPREATHYTRVGFASFVDCLKYRRFLRKVRKANKIAKREYYTNQMFEYFVNKEADHDAKEG